MVVSSPARALLAAQRQLFWNRLMRESGMTGVVAILLMTGAVAIALAPPLFVCAVAGLSLGRALGDGGSATEAARGLAAMHAALAFSLGAAAGLTHQPGFRHAGLRLFPVPPAQRLLAELPGHLFDLLPLVGCVMFTGLALGAGIARPAALPILLPLAALGMFTLLLWQQIVGSVKRMLLIKLGWGGTLLAAALLLAGLGGLLFTALEGGGPRPGAARLIRVLMLAAERLPVAQGYAGLEAALQGRWGAGLARQTAPLAATLVLFGLAAWLQRRELRMDPRPQASGGGDRVSWRFARPVAGVARLFQSQFFSSRWGKVLFGITLVYPLAAAGLLQLILHERAASGAHQLEDAFGGTGYLRLAEKPWIALMIPLIALLGNDFYFNQFGLDRQGVKLLLLLPVPGRALLLGKLLGMLRIYLLELLCGLPLLAWIHPGGWAEWLRGIGAGGAFFLMMAGVGQYFSARHPRAVREEAERGGLPPVAVVFARAGTFLAALALLLLTSHFAGRFHPAAPPVALLLLLLAALLAYRAALPRLESNLARCRERLAEELS
jgi:hypothetical protein